MKYFPLAALSVLAFLSTQCGQGKSPTNQKSHVDTDKFHADPRFKIDQEIDVLVQQTSSEVYNLARFESKGDNIDLSYFQVEISTNGDKQQYFRSRTISKNEFKDTKADLQQTYKFKPYPGLNIFFVQIQLGNVSEFDAMNKRQEVEEEIGNELMKVNAGEWMAGDIGPGGANMLFTVRNYNAALPIIYDVLKKHHLERSVLIGRRYNLAKRDWIYLVVYPKNYYGPFNTL